jgi:hypothetical protein
MKYKKPTCTCGGAIQYIEERTHEIARDITRDGTLTDKKRMHNSDIGLAECSWLECKKCDKEFEIDYDDNNMIILGEER